MTATSVKKVEGVIEEINPTTIVVAKKTIYLPPEKRDWFTATRLKAGDEIRVVYDLKGNIINAELLKPGELKEIQKNKFVPQKVVETDAEKAKKLHIQPTKGAEVGAPKSGGGEPEMHIQPERTDGGGALSDGGSKPQVHIQTGTVAPQAALVHERDWVTGKEKNDAIILQSVIARSVEIVNALYRDYPEIDYKDTGFVDLLDTRCNHIENVADRLFTYVKKKLKGAEP